MDDADEARLTPTAAFRRAADAASAGKRDGATGSLDSTLKERQERCVSELSMRNVLNTRNVLFPGNYQGRIRLGKRLSGDKINNN